MNPEQAYRKLCEDKNHKDRESLERIISEEADASYCYAIAVKRCRWELGEAAISTSAYYSYHYAVEIIGGRFVLGEAAISTSAEMSFFYSRWAIQGRLPDIMHRKMLAFGIMDSSDEWVKEYFATVAGVEHDIEMTTTRPGPVQNRCPTEKTVKSSIYMNHNATSFAPVPPCVPRQPDLHRNLSGFVDDAAVRLARKNAASMV